MAKRKNVTALDASERQQLIDAIWALKRERTAVDEMSTYDRYVVWHVRAMANLTPWVNDQRPTSRNNAHRGPAFFPWHREFLKRFEQDLQRVSNNPDLGLPYWDWATDGTNLTPAEQKQAPVWDLIGPDGDENNFFIVTQGPFAFDPARLNDPTVFDDPNVWLTVDANGRRVSVLQRAMGRGVDQNGSPIDTLPTQQDVDVALALPAYDEDPWDEQVINTFRNISEGWEGGPADQPGLHNRIHVWVGGSMGPGTSPNDPVFFLHHCNVDRIWEDWRNGHPGAGYLPESGGPLGHNLDDPMYPWNGIATPVSITPREAIDLGDAEYE